MLDGYAVLGSPGEGLGAAGPLEPCRSTTPSVATVGAEPGSARRSRTPSRTPQSAAKNAALAAQLQVCASVWSVECYLWAAQPVPERLVCKVQVV